MKVLLVTSLPPSRRAPGAIPRLLHAQVTGLRDRGHAVTVATVAGPDAHELEAVAELRAEGFAVHVAIHAEPRTVRARLERRARLLGGWLWRRWPWAVAWYWQPRLQELIDELAPAVDVIAVEAAPAGVYRFPPAVPVVYTEHEVRRPRRVRLPRGRLSRLPATLFLELDWHRWPRYQRRIWQRFAVLVAFTERDAEAIRELAPEVAPRVRVSPFGVTLPREGPRRDDATELLFVGNYSHHPNVDAALWFGREVMPLLRERRTGARLVLAGPLAPPCVRALAADDVIVAGTVEDIGEAFARAAVVVAPVRVGGGQRMKVLEAMAYGCAVVTTPRGAAGLEPREEVPLLVAETPEDTADAVAALLADPVSRAALGARARAFVEARFGPAAVAERLEALYAEAIEGRLAGGGT